jgi:mono/diheme cytochrome c family protein
MRRPLIGIGGSRLQSAAISVLFAAVPAATNGTPSEDQWLCPSGMASISVPLAPTVETVARGRQLAQQSCSECHGEAGRGDGPAAAHMSPQPSDWQSRNIQVQSDACLFWKLSTGRGNMPPAGRMPEVDRWRIIHFIRSLKSD